MERSLRGSLFCPMLTLLFAGCGAGPGDPHPGPGGERGTFTRAILSDVGGHWAEAFITVLAQGGVIAGYPDKSFKPDRIVTRAELAALVKAAFKPAPVRPPKSFPDVPTSHWAHGAIDAVVRGGFMIGDPSGLFRPQDPVKRVEVMATLVSGLKLAAPSTQNVTDFFVDGKTVPGWAKSAANHYELVVSHPVPCVLRPTAGATRAEVAVAVHQALVKQGKLPAITSNYLASEHIAAGAEYHRVEQLGFSSDSKHVWIAQSYVDEDGALIPMASGTLKQIKTSACVPGGCVMIALGESPTSVTRADAVSDVLAKTWTLRQSLGLTPLVAGTPLPETGRSAQSSTVSFRVDERNATLTVHLKQHAKICHGPPWPDCSCAAYELEVDDGHTLQVLGSLSSYRPGTHGFRVKGAVLAPDEHAVVILLEAHWQGTEHLVQTLLETVEDPFAH